MMLHTVSQRNTGWMVAALLVVGALVALLVGLLQPYVGLIALLLTIVATIGYARFEQGPRPAVRTTRRVAQYKTPSELPIRGTVVTPYGAELQAQVVPIEREDGYQMVLTSEGYMLADENGRVVHTLRP